MFRRLKLSLLLSLALSLGLIGTINAINEDAGTAGFAPLKVSISARAAAMGQAMMGLEKNPDGMQFNPASIIRLDQSEISSTYVNYYVDTNGGAVQFVRSKDPFTAYGFQLKYMNFGTMERTEISQQGDLIETGETFGAQNIIAGFSLAKFVSPMIDLGGSIKVVYDQIDDSSAMAVVLDGGLFHHPVNDRIKVGLGFRNLGLQLTHYSDSEYKETLPFIAAAGVSYRFGERVISSLDISKATGENIVAGLGLEYNLNDAFLLRGGFSSDAGDGNIGGNWGWTSGLALGAAWNWRNYQISYGLSSGGDLGLLNQLSLNYKF